MKLAPLSSSGLLLHMHIMSEIHSQIINFLPPVVSSPDCWLYIFMIFKKQVSFFNENAQMRYYKLLKQKLLLCKVKQMT